MALGLERALNGDCLWLRFGAQMDRKEVDNPRVSRRLIMSVMIGGDYGCSPDFSLGCGKMRNRLVEE